MSEKLSNIGQPGAGLIERCKRGDKNAFCKLVEQIQKIAFNIAFRILLSEEDAKDAVQDSFIKIWNNIGNYKPNALFTTWMYKIVVNTCLDYLKKRKNQNLVISVQHERHAEIENSIINNDLADKIRLLSDGLPDKQKIIFVLKDIQDFSIDEIAQILKTNKGLVKSNLYYARKRIRENFLKMEQGRQSYAV